MTRARTEQVTDQVTEPVCEPPSGSVTGTLGRSVAESRPGPGAGSSHVRAIAACPDPSRPALPRPDRPRAIGIKIGTFNGNGTPRSSVRAEVASARGSGCRGIVHPGAFPAASIIDDTLPAPVIGERAKPLAPKTRERIRRGLERLANEPFAIRLLQGGAPRPLTLPLVTLTARHDPAMVFPNAGNTYETTVNGTAEQAIVVPPMGSVDPRPAATAPAPTQTTTSRAALVQPEVDHA